MGADESVGILRGETGAFLNLGPGLAGGDGEAKVEPVAAEALGWDGEGLLELRPGAAIPRHAASQAGIGERGTEFELGNGIVVEGGDEFAADPMAGVGAGLVQDDWDIEAAQAEGQTETGEAAADDGDGAVLRGGDHRRRAIIR